MFLFRFYSIALTSLLLFIALGSFAEGEIKSPLVDPSEKVHQSSDTLRFDLSADFRSRHIWRGSLTCSAWNIQPTMNLSTNNFLIGAWGAYTVDNSYTEFDLYASYTLGNFTLAVLDYFCPDPTKKFNHLFNFKKGTTKHTLDATISYNGTNSFPVSIMASTLFYGDDINSETGNNYYSTYIEAGYHWRPKQNTEVDFHLGITPFKGYYAHQPYVVSSGASVTQTIKVTPTFSLPINGRLIVNPYTESVYFVFGFSVGI